MHGPGAHLILLMIEVFEEVGNCFLLEVMV